MADSIIKLKDISVIFKDEQKELTAVKDVNLEIEKGDIYGVIGYSGAGKSTLVRVINLLQKPTKGTVQVNKQQLLDLDESKLRQARKKIEMIFQHFNLMKSRTVLNNVEYPLLRESISKSDRQDKARKLLELVGLAEFENAYPDQLSGGQKQRVAIARALANDPEVLISDEATSALDPKTTMSILKLLKHLNQQLGVTIVLITHEMQAIKTICHNVAVMEKGQIIERGPVASVFTEPQQPLTKDFVDTSTNVKEALSRIGNDPQISKLDKNQRLITLSFVGQSSKQSLISELARKLNVDANILFANVDQIDGISVGTMIAILTGTPDTLKQAVSLLTENGVKITEVKSSALKEDDAND